MSTASWKEAGLIKSRDSAGMLSDMLGHVDRPVAVAMGKPLSAAKRAELAIEIMAWTPQDAEDYDPYEEPVQDGSVEELERLRTEAMHLSWDDLGMTGLNDELIDAMCTHIEDTCASVRNAAIEVGLDPSLMLRWLSEGKRLSDESDQRVAQDPIVWARHQRLRQLAMRLIRSQNNPVNGAARTIVTAARAGDVKAAEFLLTHSPQGRKDWGKRTEVNHKGKVEHNVRPQPGSMSHLKDVSATELQSRLNMQSNLLERPQRPGNKQITTIDVTPNAD